MAIIGHGSKLTIIGPTGTTTINKDLACLSIDTGSNKIDTPDTTDMLTPGTTRVFTPALENPGDVSLKYNVNPTDASQLALKAAKGIMYDFKITYPGGSFEEKFSGIVTSVDETIPDDKPITRSAKIQKSGPTTEDVPSGS